MVSIYWIIIIFILYMANFKLQLKKHDDYMTPKYAWENIQHLIPKDKVIWEAFYGGKKW